MYKATQDSNLFVRDDGVAVPLNGIGGASQALATWLTAGGVPVAYVPVTSPKTVLSQDLMAQFTVADFTAIKTAVANSDNFGLLWASLQAQKDPMILTKARFKAGWSALVTVLGATRMAAIATALGVTIV